MNLLISKYQLILLRVLVLIRDILLIKRIDDLEIMLDSRLEFAVDYGEKVIKAQ